LKWAGRVFDSPSPLPILLFRGEFEKSVLIGSEGITAAVHQEIGEFLVDLVVEVFRQLQQHATRFWQQLRILQQDGDLLSFLTQTF